MDLDKTCGTRFKTGGRDSEIRGIRGESFPVLCLEYPVHL